MTPEMVTAIITSTVVSSVITLFLRIILENNQQHRFSLEIEELKHTYEVELEKIKAENVVTADVQHEVIERKLRSFPKLVELIYRTRNMAREIVNGDVNPVLAEEFRARANEFEDLLFQSRIDLERESIFVEAHGYKNLLRMFGSIAADINMLRCQEKQGDQFTEAMRDLRQAYESIEASHKPLISQISAKSLTVDVATGAK